MSLMDRIRDAFAPIVPSDEARVITFEKMFGTAQDIDSSWGFAASSGESVTSETIMRAAAGACVRLLADDISALPVDVYRKSGNESTPIDPPSWVRSPSGRPFDDIAQLIGDIVVSLGSGGVAFVYGLPSIFRPEYLEVLDPDVTTVEQDRNTGQRFWRNADVQGSRLTETNVAQIDWVRRPGALRGLSPIDASRESSGLELAAQRWAGAFFKNGGTLGGIIRVPGGPETVDPDKIMQSFAARHTGRENWWRPGVLTGGAEYDDVTASPKEADLEPLWRHCVEEAARLYHIPPHLLGSQTSGAVSYASVEHRSIEYVQHAVVPFTTRIERALSRLIPGDDTYLKLNTNALLRGDINARGQFYNLMLQAKVMTRDEVREKEDLPYMGELGWLETPNNTGDAEPPARSLSIDTVTIADQSAERIADTAAAGAAVAAAEARKTAEGVSADLRALTETVRAQAAEIATLRDDRASITALLTERNRPPDIRIDGDHVYYQRGTEVERKKVIRDETGRVIGMVAA